MIVVGFSMKSYFGEGINSSKKYHRDRKKVAEMEKIMIMSKVFLMLFKGVQKINRMAHPMTRFQ